jgi:hypothetical protein
LERPEVFVNANITGHGLPLGIVGQNESQVADFGDHGVFPIDRTLTTPARVYMHIRYHRLSCGSALLPDLSEVTAVEFYDAVPKTVGVYIVIEQESLDLARTATPLPEKECTALMTTARAPAKFVDPGKPHGSCTYQPRRLTERCTQERWN